MHFHALVLDGVYVHADGDPRAPLEFRELDAPTHADVAQVAARTAARIESILKAHGRSLDPELGEQELPELCFDEPGLAACYAAAAQGIGVSGERAGKPLLRLVVPAELPERPRAADATDAPIAEVRGINLHAAQVIDGRDRRRVERLAKYITRPPIAQDRLERRQDGRLELIFKKVWRDGTRALVLEPHDLIARLVAAVPPPRFHMLRYFGVLSSHSSRRALVVPKPPVDAACHKPPPARGDQLELLGEKDDAPVGRKRWAWLLAHVFAADVETCPRCSGPMRWAEVATSRAAITRLIAEHEDGQASRAPPAARVPVLSENSSATKSSRTPMVVAERSAEPLPTSNRSRAVRVCGRRFDQRVAEALVISL
ncbi:MAG: transposase [Myxococcales bacterium]|nr:transposase [Myxococcales bacterium]